MTYTIGSLFSGNGVVPRQAAHALRIMRDREWQIARYGEVA